MEIDPRLRPTDASINTNTTNTSRDGRHHRLPYNQLPASSGAAGAGASTNDATGAYPDLSPQSSTDQLTSSSSSNNAYYGGSSAASHSFYPNEASGGASGAAPCDTTDPNDPLADLKRPRACEACRQLKVRCEPDNDHPTGSCKRCAKAGRTCVVTAPTRKRQKKTDSRVAELEKKIDALTASLHASRAADVGASSDLGSHQGQEHVAPRRWLGGGPPPPRLNSTTGVSPTLGGAKRHLSGEIKTPGRYGNGLFTPFSARPGSPPCTAASSASASGSTWTNAVDPVLRGDVSNEFADVIDRGIVDVENARKAFDRYVNDFAPIMPTVVFPPGTTMGSVRHTKPVLFLVILSITIGAFQPGVQMQLIHEVHRVIADRVVIKGEKSLELVQAIMVSCMWYAPPDHFEELKFFQFIHMAVVMALDIGMGRRTRKKGTKQLSLLREILGKKGTLLDPDSLETRRAWMGCYFMAVCASMALRRSLLVRWHPYMDECIDILQNSPDALPSDRLLIYWAKLSHIAEEVSFQFSMDDPASNLSLHDAKVQYALKGFEKQLDQWREEVDPEYYTPMLKHAEHVLNIYMHEISMHTDHNIDDFRPPFWGSFRDEPQVDRASAAHVDALTSCLTSIHATLEVMMSLDHDTIVCLPTMYFARTSYALVALLKLFAAVTQSNSSLGQVFSPADLKVEEHLDKMIAHLKVSGTRPGGRTAGKFCMILNLLKNWFLTRKENDDPSQLARMPVEEGRTSETKDGHGHGQSGQSKSDSRLHLLSEVAMGEPSKVFDSQQSQPGKASFPQPATNVGVSVSPAAVDSSSATPSTNGPISAADTTESWSQYPSAAVVSTDTTTAEPAFYPQQQQQQIAFAQQAEYDPSNNNNNPMLSSNMMAGSQPAYAGFVPELGMQMGFDPEGLFALGNMLDEGFFNLPMMDGNQNFYPLD
ncbi:hypothetical protein VTN77DRAFT_6845 [Rasamsonia byssochlamydoides]|uniref:uncharacterized protein n=1 Tax=Rasamsonia byssochlamydoides TaxID=89139 RepID=UPI003744A178